MPDFPTYHTPVTICWHCDRPLDAATPPPGREDQELGAGAISLCLYCGAIAIFGDDLALRSPTKDELEHMREDREFMNTYMSFAWSRQYVMIQSNLLRDREDPDR